MGVDCRDWDEDTYRQRVLEERESQCRTVFRTAFAPSPNHNPDLIVAASSDGSIASYSISSLALDFGNSRAQNSLLARPQRLLQGHHGPAYDVKFCGTGEDSLLLSCGDDGRIRGWMWKEFSNTEDESPLQDDPWDIQSDTELPFWHIHLEETVVLLPEVALKPRIGGHLKPILDLVNPQYKGPWGSLSPIPESNAIAVDNQGESIFLASGDSCAYCWDVERSEMKMVFKGHSDYLHCVVARNSGNQIITGSEDGTARIWDCRSGKCVQVIDLAKDRKLKESHVSCVALDASENWLACGNGQNLSVWNLPARDCISTISTRASIQDAVFDGNQILAVGAEPSLSRFDMNGAILSQIQCAPQSAFSISLHPTGVTAVAGYGGLVDVISQFGSHLCTYRC